MPKIYAVCGAAGFVLSFIVGLFSGASFLLILLKAVIFGAVFAGLAVLINFLLNRFVPDLFDKEAIAALKPKASGAKLDITISDADDASPEDDLSSFPDFMKHRSQAKSAPPRASAATSGAVPSASAVPSEVGEMAESAPASEVAQSEIAPSEAEAKPEEEASSASSVSEEEEGGELDDMPDAEVFASEDEEFGSDGVESEDASDREPSPSTESTAPKFSANGVDAELMARAIRTVLSKNN